MVVLNDEKNTESNKLTLMKYAKKFMRTLIQVKIHKFIMILIFGKRIISSYEDVEEGDNFGATLYLQRI